MSLDVYLYIDVDTGGPEPHRVYLHNANVTHNLNTMAKAAGIYGPVWRPDENSITHARQMIPYLRAGIENLTAFPGIVSSGMRSAPQCACFGVKMIATVPCTRCDDLLGAGEPALCGLCVRQELAEWRTGRRRVKWRVKARGAGYMSDLTAMIRHNGTTWHIEAIHFPHTGTYDVTLSEIGVSHRHAQVRGFDAERGTLALVCECIKALGGWKERLKRKMPPNP